MCCGLSRAKCQCSGYSATQPDPQSQPEKVTNVTTHPLYRLAQEMGIVTNASPALNGTDDGLPDPADDYREYLDKHRKAQNAPRDQAQQANNQRVVSPHPQGEDLYIPVVNYATGKIEYK